MPPAMERTPDLGKAGGSGELRSAIVGDRHDPVTTLDLSCCTRGEPTLREQNCVESSWVNLALRQRKSPDYLGAVPGRHVGVYAGHDDDLGVPQSLSVGRDDVGCCRLRHAVSVPRCAKVCQPQDEAA
jgi:hypothetical protein